MNIEDAITQSITKMAGKKNGAVVLGIGFMYLMKDHSWNTLALIAGLAGLCITLQFILDMIEVWQTGTREPENGNGNGGEVITSPAEKPPVG